MVTKRRFSSVAFSLMIFLALLCNAECAEIRPVYRGANTPPPSGYTFAVIPFYSPEKIWSLYAPFVDYLTTTTGATWELKLFHNHDEFIKCLCNGSISMALVGPVPLSRANAACGATPLLVALGKDGLPSYHSVIVTSDAAISNLQGLKGKKVGFFKGSTAAHIVPLKLMKDAGVGIPSLQPVYLESQDRIITALMSGDIAAAGIKESLFRKFARPPLKVLKVSEPLPNFALCSTSSLPEQIRKRLIASLTSLKPHSSPKSRNMVKSWDDEVNNGFMVPDKDFMPSVMKLNAVFKEVSDGH